MMLRLRKYPLIALAVLFGLVLNGYIFLHEVLTKYARTDKSKLSDACIDPSLQVPQENPNKMLFVSCGGFIE